MKKKIESFKKHKILIANIVLLIAIGVVTSLLFLSRSTMAVPDIPTTIRVENIHRVHDPFQPNYTETSAMQGIAGTETVVYCYNISKQTMQHADMMTLASTVTDPGLVYIIENGYPNKNPMPSGDKYDNYFVTQWTMWAYKSLYYGEPLDHGNSSVEQLRTAYGAYSSALGTLLDGAIAARDKGVNTNPTLSFSGSFTMSPTTINGQLYYMSSPITVNASTSTAYRLTVTAPSGYYLVNNNNQQISASSLRSGQVFKVVVPASSLTSGNTTITLKANATFSWNQLRLYTPSPPDASVQDGLLAVLYPAQVERGDTISTTIAARAKIRVVKTAVLENGQIEYVKGAKLRISSSDDVNFQPQEWTTDGTPKEFSNLIPGRTYTVTEVSPASGYIHNTGSKSYTVTTNDSFTSGDNITTIDFRNSYTKICIQKTGKDTNQAISGARLRLINKSTGAIVHEWTSTNQATCFTKVPVGTYRLVEVSAPTDQGYVLSPEKEITVQSTASTQNYTFANDYTNVCFAKVDKDTNQLISGARLQLVNKDTKEVVKEWTSSNQETCFTRLPVDDYQLVELRIPAGQGYVSAPTQDVSITATSQTQHFSMKDDYTKICIQKIDRDSGETVAGATLQLIDKSTGKIVHEWISEKEATCFTKVPVGAYRLVEIAAPTEDGYVLSPEKEISIKDTPEVQNYALENDYTKACFAKVDIDDPTKLVTGATLQLVNKATGEVVHEWTSGDQPTCFTHLAVTDYQLVEVKIPEGQGYVTAPSQDITIEATKDTQNFTMVDDYTKVCFAKVDKDDGITPVVGATLQLIDTTSGDVIHEWVSEKEPTCFTRVPVGHYELKEIEAPTDQGYVISPSEEIIIQDTPDQQHFSMDDDYTKICFRKVDRDDPTKLVSGATLRLINKQTKEVWNEWVSIPGATCFTKVPVGDYELVEVVAPTDQGYVMSPSKDITVEATATVQEYTLEDDYTKICIQKVDPDTKEFITGAKLVLTGPLGYRQEILTTSAINAYCYTHLPVGTYRLEEVETPPGYITSPTISFNVDDSTLQTVIMNDLKTKVQVLKLDAETNQPLAGAELAIIDSNGSEVATWTSGTAAYEILGLPLGKYTLIEKQAPTGYEKFADYSFEVKNKHETVVIEATDTVIVEVPDTAQSMNIILITIGSIFIIGGGLGLGGYLLHHSRKKIYKQ